MAHFMKSKKGDALRIAREAFRECDSTSEHFNKDLSNTNLYSTHFEAFRDEYYKRLTEHPTKRKDNVILIHETLTRPRELRPQDEERFWNEVKRFNDHKLNKDNFAYMAIHNDELTQHAHIAYFALKDDEWKAKHILTRDFLKSYHKELQQHIDRQLGYHVTIEKDELTKQYEPHLTYNEYKAARQREREIDVYRERR